MPLQGQCDVLGNPGTEEPPVGVNLQEGDTRYGLQSAVSGGIRMG